MSKIKRFQMSRFFLCAFFVLCITLLSSASGYAREVGGVILPDTMDFHGHTMKLNGAGVRTFLMLKIYAGGLYLTSPNSDPAKIMTADEPMAIRMHIISGRVTNKMLADARRDGFEKSTEGNLAPIETRIKYLNSLFNGVPGKDVCYDLVYLPEEGVSLWINGKKQGVIDGLDFKAAVFGIWLCDKPAQKKLKKGMLGL